MMRKFLLTGSLCILTVAGSAWAGPQTQVQPQPPSIEFGQLFRDVQLQSIFPDNKTFCDMEPKEAPSVILAAYNSSNGTPGFDLTTFVGQHFDPPFGGPNVNPAAPGEPIQTYIAGLWDILRQQTPANLSPYSSLLPLPDPYVVPGGRFREVYYWDSYFTMLGLEADNRHELAEDLVKDFAYEIDRYGHVPNGARSYYLSRSQPPFFSLMVDLVADRDGDDTYLTYLPALQKEYSFWMEGADDLAPGEAHRRVVRLADGTILNRYWDDRDVPRDESYIEDVTTALMSERPPAEIYRNLRATAESGWDFSSRWLADDTTLATIRTVSMLPVDLNSLIQHLELTLAKAYGIKGDKSRHVYFKARAAERAAAIRGLMWDPLENVFTDYLWQEAELTHRTTAATMYPLFFNIATPDQAHTVAQTVLAKLLMPNGMATTLTNTGLQWDQPNGWAPLQWITIAGLNNYGEKALAKDIAERWMQVNGIVYQTTHKLVEKYHLLTPTGGGGGEYATQIGFGWTNGVLRKLMTLYPQIATSTAELALSTQAAK